MVVLLAPVIFLLALFSGCSVGDVTMGAGGAPDAGAGNTMAAQTFDSTIKPLVMSTGCVTCHLGVQPPDLTAFAKLDARYKTKPSGNNILVNKGPHQNALWFNATQKQTVAAWVDTLP